GSGRPDLAGLTYPRKTGPTARSALAKHQDFRQSHAKTTSIAQSRPGHGMLPVNGHWFVLSGEHPMIELSEVIRDLRAELETAIAAAPEDGLRLELGPVELEVSLGIDKTAGGGAKVRFWVVELGPEASVARSSVQRVKLTLVPRMAPGNAQP